MNKQQFYDAQMSEKSNTKNTNLQENVVNSQPKQEIYTDITFESPYEIEYDNPSSDSGPQVIRHDENLKQTWKYGVFDCFANWRLCLLASFAPCVPFGETSKAAAHGECLQWQVNNEHRNMTVFRFRCRLLLFFPFYFVELLTFALESPLELQQPFL